MEIHSAVNLGPRVQVHFKGKGRTKQADRDSVDINLIMKKYVRTGLIDHFSKHGAEYGFASALTFHECMNVVSKAETMFEELPAQARARFEGDPAVFLEFVQNPANQAEMFKLGLSDKPPEKATDGPVVASAPITPEVVSGGSPADAEPESAL